MDRHARQAFPWPGLVALLIAQLWIAHALAFFAHEYAHAIVAWGLGWKASPFDLHVPPVSPILLLMQLGINQNVDEAPIFASGHGADAAWIALAGAGLGNALVSLPLGRLVYGRAKALGRRGWALLGYWITAASVGNLFAYVPIRTFTLESDMGSARRGFGWSGWELLAILGLPVAVALGWFVVRAVPATLRWAFPESAGRRIALAIVTAYVLFGFYGMAGLLEGGPVSYRLSQLSIFVLFPLVALIEAIIVARPAARG